MLRAITIAATYDLNLSQSIISQIQDTEKMSPLFDQKVSKERVGEELNKMFHDKKTGIKALSMMTDLGILENYVTLMCTPDAEKIPDYCFLIGKFMEEETVSIVDDSMPTV
jgi:tRNA nucleotidyltransferase/poly(A) polymerase